MTVAAKEFRYAIELDRTGRVTADGSSPLDLDAAWTPEHLVLVGLVRCTLQSLGYHAAMLELDFLANASASAMVTRRAEDGRYAFVEIDVELELEVLEPPPVVSPGVVFWLMSSGRGFPLPSVGLKTISFPPCAVVLTQVTLPAAVVQFDVIVVSPR